MDEIQATLPGKAYSPKAFNAEASRLDIEFDRDELPNCKEEFIDFVLTGRSNLGNHQAVIDVTLDAEVREILFVTRDYDSLLGICSEIRVQRTINVFPVSNPNFALTKSIHLSHTMSVGGVSVFLPFTYAWYSLLCFIRLKPKCLFITSLTVCLASLATDTESTSFSPPFIPRSGRPPG